MASEYTATDTQPIDVRDQLKNLIAISIAPISSGQASVPLGLHSGVARGLGGTVARIFGIASLRVAALVGPSRVKVAYKGTSKSAKSSAWVLQAVQ